MDTLGSEPDHIQSLSHVPTFCYQCEPESVLGHMKDVLGQMDVLGHMKDVLGQMDVLGHMKDVLGQMKDVSEPQFHYESNILFLFDLFVSSDTSTLIS